VGLFCNIPAQGLTGLIGYSYQQVATSFLEAHLERCRCDRPGSSFRVRTSEDKVRRKDLCWSVRAVYVLESGQM
jgi:hypothetical protein